MPNWKKVIVSGSDAEFASIKSDSFYIPITGSGSVPLKAYDLVFADTSSGDNFDQIYTDNQNKLTWYPAGGLTVIGNITAGDHSATNPSFITASNIIASRHLTASGVMLNGLPQGTTENRILVSSGAGNVGYRTDLNLQGTTGAQGTTGPQGDQGIQGEKGQKGNNGVTGAQGIQGTTGDTGAQGITGTKGQKGEVGAQGITGDTGAQGITGQKGQKGEVGETGAQGTTGDTGSQGTTGQKGQKGEVGSTGLQGITGTKGQKGDEGDVGAQGTTGATGAQGITRYNR